MSLLILTVILALLTAISSILEIERSSKFYKAKIIFVAIFFLGTAIASIFQFRLSEAESIKANKKDSAFAKSQSDIIQLQKINKRESDSLDKVIISLSSKLNSKSENILNQSRNILAYTTGGEDNKPYIQLHFIKNNGSSYDVHFMVVNPGKYPLSHFSYDLTDMESEMFEFSKLNNLNPYNLNKAQQDEKEKFDQINIKNSFHNGSIGNFLQNQDKISTQVNYILKVVLPTI